MQVEATRLESVLLFETPEELLARVFRELRPRTAEPAVSVRFRRYAGARASIRLSEGRLEVEIADVLADAPAPVLEALAYILCAKLLREPVPRHFQHRYRLYLNRRDMRAKLHALRQERGRKLVKGPSGAHFDLVEIFEELNLRYFHGLMARPELHWSRRPSRTTLGHYDPSHHVIVLSSLLDGAEVPRLAVEYIMFHEMLHLRHPVEHRGARRCVHTREFKQAERAFERLAEAKDLLKKLPHWGRPAAAG